MKLWVAIAGFALGASLGRYAFGQPGLLQKLGTAVFLPQVVGWAGAMGSVVLVMAAWYAFATWNEQSGKFSLTNA